MKENLRSHLVEIARQRDPYIASFRHFCVRKYICDNFQKYGKAEIHSFKARGKIHENIVLNLPGLAAEPPILIGAHYDAVPGSPGADDNATGVAALLELARIFAEKPARYPLRLVAFDLEENGLLGSTAYAQELKEKRESLRLMIALEMLGYCDPTPGSQLYPEGLKHFYSDRGDFIALIGNFATIFDLIRLSGQIQKSGIPCQWLPVPFSGEIVPDTRRSDHAPFWDNGYPALMVTDTANMRNPHYHKPSDTIETLDLDFFTGVCKGLVASIRSL